MLHIKLNVDFVFLPRVSFLWSSVRNSSYSLCRGESGIFSKTILRLRWHVRIAQDTAGRRYRYATTKGYRRGIARWRRGRIEDGSSSLTKFNNTVIEVCDYADAWCTLGYTGCSKTVEAEAVTALSSGSLLLHPRQAGALWGHIEVGDRRLQWHLRQISIWITPPPHLLPPPFRARHSLTRFPPSSAISPWILHPFVYLFLRLLIYFAPPFPLGCSWSPSALCAIYFSCAFLFRPVWANDFEGQHQLHRIARYNVLWVHVSVNFGNRYLDGLFAIFHYACKYLRRISSHFMAFERQQ